MNKNLVRIKDEVLKNKKSEHGEILKNFPFESNAEIEIDDDELFSSPSANSAEELKIELAYSSFLFISETIPNIRENRKELLKNNIDNVGAQFKDFKNALPKPVKLIPKKEFINIILKINDWYFNVLKNYDPDTIIKSSNENIVMIRQLCDKINKNDIANVGDQIFKVISYFLNVNNVANGWNYLIFYTDNFNKMFDYLQLKTILNLEEREGEELTDEEFLNFFTNAKLADFYRNTNLMFVHSLFLPFDVCCQTVIKDTLKDISDLIVGIIIDDNNYLADYSINQLPSKYNIERFEVLYNALTIWNYYYDEIYQLPSLKTLMKNVTICKEAFIQLKVQILKQKEKTGNDIVDSKTIEGACRHFFNTLWDITSIFGEEELEYIFETVLDYLIFNLSIDKTKQSRPKII